MDITDESQIPQLLSAPQKQKSDEFNKKDELQNQQQSDTTQ